MVCLAETEARQRYTPREKGCGCPSEECSKGAASYFHRSVLLGLCLLLANYLDSLSMLTYPGPHRCAQTPQPRDRSWSENFWEEQGSSWPGVILTLDPQEPFCTSVASPFSQKELGVSLNPLLRQGLCLFVLAVTIAVTINVKCWQEMKTSQCPVSVTSLSEGKQEASCQCLNGTPPNSCLKEMLTAASIQAEVPICTPHEMWTGGQLQMSDREPIYLLTPDS